MAKDKAVVVFEDKNYIALQSEAGSELMDAMIDNMEEGTNPFDLFENVPVPRAPGAPWKMPILTDTGTEYKNMDSFTGILLHSVANKTMFEFAYDSDDRVEGARPLCSSPDGKIGIGTPGGDCVTCPNNQFGSGKGGSKACADSKILYILMEDKPLPIIVKLTPGTTKAGSFLEYKKYMLTLTRSFKSKSGVETRFSLGTAKNAKNIEFSIVEFSINDIIKDKKLKADIIKYKEALLPHFTRVEPAENNEAQPVT